MEAFQRPLNYDSFYLLPKAVNPRPGMRYAPNSQSPSKNVQSPANLASRLSAKAKSFVPKTNERKSHPRDASPAKSESSMRSKYSSSSSSSPNDSPKLFADDDDFYPYSEAPKHFMLQRGHKHSPSRPSSDMGSMRYSQRQLSGSSYHSSYTYDNYGYERPIFDRLNSDS
mmetsp:Transcript_22244/g.31072  ORF Transcript_22244/g.31072 Transcript_22244/m.31072 type:complete len:170 (+) Transcript_22244:108-617(+)|eukprot:CAMPEP_0184487074 /NCGR_PEP_ID=MMETSP0113_2-20130426/9166_1 /TAXON_ID=91329 /ORGANISM="Norrisiella sphaerica, Strain BC52" /LENGTH=169 /DNA_ID=CAMNT_0026869241 /DNA_START=89 /DNA_END=598 /DNA_ORIENTATION=-